MIRNNYHTHTARCGHAIGDDEDYILEAIGMGMQSLGFSDHIMLKGFSQPHVRGDFSLTEDYFSSLQMLKEKYKERIRIFVAFEAEVFEDYFPYYRELLDTGKIDYLILGNHFAVEQGIVKSFFSQATSKKDLIQYKDTLIKGMATGLFAFVAHPDYFMGGYKKWDATCETIAKEICEAALRYQIPLEFNFAALRRGKVSIGDVNRYLYPHLSFWKIVNQYQVPVILGLDAHAPEDLSSYKNDEGFEFLKLLDLNIVHELPYLQQKEKKQ